MDEFATYTNLANHWGLHLSVFFVAIGIFVGPCQSIETVVCVGQKVSMWAYKVHINDILLIFHGISPFFMGIYANISQQGSIRINLERSSQPSNNQIMCFCFYCTIFYFFLKSCGIFLKKKKVAAWLH